MRERAVCYGARDPAGRSAISGEDSARAGRSSGSPPTGAGWAVAPGRGHDRGYRASTCRRIDIVAEPHSILHSTIMAQVIRFECDGRQQGPREIARVACDQSEQAHPVDLDRLLTVGAHQEALFGMYIPGSRRETGWLVCQARHLDSTAPAGPTRTNPKLNSHWSVGSSVRTVGNGRRAVRRDQVDLCAL
jgi:hypothetical protein